MITAMYTLQLHKKAGRSTAFAEGFFSDKAEETPGDPEAGDAEGWKYLQEARAYKAITRRVL